MRAKAGSGNSLSPAICLVLLAVAFPPASSAANVDWRDYLGGPERNHYSPLDQIHTGNVSQLKPAWEYHTGDLGEMQCNPIIVDGILFAVTAANGIVALDAATGAERWRHVPPGITNNRIVRGLTYWPGDGEPRILFSLDSTLCALNARTGDLIESFGENGRTSLKAGLGEGAQSKWVVSTTPGALFEDLLIMPTRVTEGPDAAPGFIQAFNVRTGALVWTFRTIPKPGEFGHDTWPPDAHLSGSIGGANSWAGMAVDVERGIVYAPTGSASPDFWGGDRKGRNLFANCLLALDARTGALRWHYQFVRHDLWDRDAPAPPNLVTVRREGRTIDAVAQVTKSGHVFVFDRVTGVPLFPIQEVPAPRAELPGEETWPTQPVPLAPAPFSRQALTEDDLNRFSGNRDELLSIFRQARTGAFEPFGMHDTLIFPGFDGAAEWGGAAVDPDGILYVNANEMAWIARLTETPRQDALAHLSPGNRIYTMFCIGCHGPERLGNPSSGFPSLVDLGMRRRRDEIAALLATGKGMMPGFPWLVNTDRQSLLDFLLGTEKIEGGTGVRVPGPMVPSADEAYAPYKLVGYVKFLDTDGYPAISPPWGSLTAIDLNTGERRWRITLGEFSELTAQGIPPTGTENYGGPVVTAGGLLFIAATKDGMFRAFDKRTGKLLWETRLPAAGFATPSTYAVGGRQYIVVAAGGTKLGTAKGDSFVAFALP